MANDETDTLSEEGAGENVGAKARVEVHSKFADWYRNACTQIPSGVPEARTSALNSFIADATRNDLLDTVTLFFGKKTRDAGFEVKFHEYFNSFDSGFPLQGSHNEMMVLAGITIGTILSEESERADLVALTARCLSFQGEFSDVVVPDVLEETSRYLEKRATKLRTRAEAPSIDMPSFSDLNEKAKGLASIPANQPATLLGEIGETLLDRVNVFMKRVVDAMNAQIEADAARDEEIDIMWWLVGASCRFDNMPFKGKTIPEVCLTSALDLANLTKLGVAPLGANAYLDGILRGVAPNFDSTTVTIGETIDSTNMRWRDYSLKNAPNSVIEAQGHIVPIVYGIKQSCAAERTWKGSYAESIGVSADQAFHPLRVAIQLYMELLLLKCLSTSS